MFDVSLSSDKVVGAWVETIDYQITRSDAKPCLLQPFLVASSSTPQLSTEQRATDAATWVT